MKNSAFTYIFILLFIPCIGLGLCYGDLYAMTHNYIEQPYLDIARSQDMPLPTLAQLSE